jgi:hypothetical protein
MSRRIALTVILILTLAAGGVSAHEKGDLVLNIEPELGFSFPSIQLISRNMRVGFGYTLKTTVDYYFLDSLAANVGLGITGNQHDFKIGGGINPVVFVPILGFFAILNGSWLTREIELGKFYSSYITIPFGLRFSKRAFTFGAGLSGNIPINADRENLRYYDRKIFVLNEPNQRLYFDLLPYMGWSLDIGFDASFRKRPKNSFGMLLRLNGPLTLHTLEPDSKYPQQWDMELTNNANFVSLDLVFRFSFGLANLPIGGKK